MKKILRVVLIVIILALAAYGAYSLTEKTVSYFRYREQHSSVIKIQNIKNGVSPVPHMEFTAFDGSKISLYNELKKKDFVIVSFGSIYCTNCHKEYKTLESDNMLSKLPENAEIFFVVPEERDFIKQFEKDLDIHIPLFTINRKYVDEVGITGIPTSVVIGKDGKIKMYYTGFKESVLQDMYDYIKKNAH